VRRKSKDGGGEPSRLGKWLENAKARGASVLKGKKLGNLGSKLSKRLPDKFKKFDFDLKEVNLKNVSEYSTWIRWGLVVLGVFLLAQITAGIIGLNLKPTFPKPPPRVAARPTNAPQVQDFGGIERRNIFNVEGTIPEPIEAGQLDCMSQARPTSQPIELLGTIVMSDERFSVALINQSGNQLRLGVKKDDLFGDGKYQAMKVDRKRLCFQVRATQEMEYVEIPEEKGGMAVSQASFVGGASGTGIKPVSETQYEVKRTFLDEKLGNLTNILQTARAVPYTDPGTGKFKGFLIQSIDSDSPFAELGLRQGDVLTGVNNIVLDNPGKGLEAFQALRGSDAINLKIIRGGRDSSLQYSVK
jgi:general secretion pathway protein C